MSNYKSAPKVSQQLPEDWALIYPLFGGLAGVAIGLLIANLVGIV